MMMTSEQATEGTRVVLGATWGFWENTGNGEAFRRANADLPGTITRVIVPGRSAFARRNASPLPVFSQNPHVAPSTTRVPSVACSLVIIIFISSCGPFGPAARRCRGAGFARQRCSSRTRAGCA